ncbi:MAG: dockerin type I repeat-containing protein [Ruminococcus flavefaciens]|nr:dockerin type I repeat-containing protein [Ruminococcus flavefaciens]MCM1061444.1 dockerin type I repeat-containing protein [Eubacterium sp.]
MKKFKHAAISGLAAVVTLAAVPTIHMSSAQAADYAPKMYLDFTVESDGDIRADVVIENMPAFATCGFHVVLDEGLRFAKSSEGEDMEGMADGMYGYKIIDDNIATCTYMQSHDEDLNGHFVAFYVERTEVNNPFNSTGKILFRTVPISDMVSTMDDGYIYNPSQGTGSINTPEMLESNEYLVGDVSGNGVVDGIDATRVLRACELSGGDIKIKDINGNFTNEIPDLRSAYAADVNNDGFISQADADLLLRYYTIIISNMSYDGNIGKVDIYEIYND